MVTLYTDTRMLDHKPPERHPDRPERLAAVLRHLDRTGLRPRLAEGTAREATDEELLRVHTPGYLRRVDEASKAAGTLVEPDTWLGPGSREAARLAAGCVVEATSEVVGGRAKTALCLVRPPGHHARPDDAMGFCLYASVAAAAADAVERLGLARVLVVDFDVHHGNGTQEIFYDDPRVAFLSAHRYPFYPGTGAKGETGTGKGLGTTLNIPVKYGTPRKDYLKALASGVEAFADAMRPELVIASSGFDAHAEDPVGDLGLEVEDFIEVTNLLKRVAAHHAGGRLVSVLEGGYNVPILAGCVAAHANTLLEPA